MKNILVVLCLMLFQQAVCQNQNYNSFKRYYQDMSSFEQTNDTSMVCINTDMGVKVLTIEGKNVQEVLHLSLVGRRTTLNKLTSLWYVDNSIPTQVYVEFVYNTVGTLLQISVIRRTYINLFVVEPTYTE